MITKINTTKDFDLSNLSSRDVLAFMNYILDTYRFNHIDAKVVITAHNAKIVDDREINGKMTEVFIYFIAHNSNTNINDNYVYRCYRAKDWSCSNISIESYK